MMNKISSCLYGENKEFIQKVSEQKEKKKQRRKIKEKNSRRNRIREIMKTN